VMPYAMSDTLVIHDFYARRDAKGKAVEPVKLLTFPAGACTRPLFSPSRF